MHCSKTHESQVTLFIFFFFGQEHRLRCFRLKTAGKLVIFQYTCTIELCCAGPMTSIYLFLFEFDLSKNERPLIACQNYKTSGPNFLGAEEKNHQQKSIYLTRAKHLSPTYQIMNFLLFGNVIFLLIMKINRDWSVYYTRVVYRTYHLNVPINPPRYSPAFTANIFHSATHTDNFLAFFVLHLDFHTDKTKKKASTTEKHIENVKKKKNDKPTLNLRSYWFVREK